MKTTLKLFAAALLLAGTVSALAQVHYVDVNSTNATPPYSSWATAATNIQDAVDASAAGDEIVVTNGVYVTGGRAVSGTTNRVAVDKPLSLRSVNGPQSTTINGGFSVRCVYLTNGASLSGFTLTNGRATEGGGLWCQSTTAVVSNCIVSGNGAGQGPFGTAVGGGAYGGTLNNCALSDNRVGADFSASGGGAYRCTLNNCTLNNNSVSTDQEFVGDVSAYANGGGAYACTLNNCTLTGNRASCDNATLDWSSGTFASGGAAESALNNCTLIGNSAIAESHNYGSSYAAGGAYQCTLNNCMLIGNSGRAFSHSIFASLTEAGGADSSTLNNCIVYFNTVALLDANYASCTLNYSCTTPWPVGVGNITNAPLFVDQATGNLRLQSNSPCINAGLNALASAGPDLDGNPRIVGGTVDIGAYEFQSPASMISYAWLQQFNLPINPATDTADADGDSLNNWQEWRCATDPTNALSALRLLAAKPIGPDVVVQWQSVPGQTYFLEWSTNLTAFPPFMLLSTNLAGEAATTTYTHTNAAGAGGNFYRVGVP